MNLTPDSFYANSRMESLQKVVDKAGAFIEEGASIIDIGGQSTRPGAIMISEEEEIERVSGAIESISKVFPTVKVSIDTFQSKVAKAAIEAGATIVNDISCGSFDPDILEVVAQFKVGYIGMHITGTKDTMHVIPERTDIIEELIHFFTQKKQLLADKGIQDWIIDPGFGFGKTIQDNFTIIKDLRKVTLVAMTSVDIEKTVRAMVHSCKDIVFGDIKFISDIKPEYLPTQFKYCQIEKMNSIDDYSYNMVYNLHKFIDTEFALVIQADGYIVNPHMWQDDFLNYDYIGAPWNLPNDDFSFRDPFNNIIRVGNGGFSLRSKKLLSLPTELNLEWKSYFGYYNEDGFFTCHNRHLFEKEGCVFAPLDVAKYFSHEAEIPETYGIEPFGFHGKWSKYLRPL
jgi:dihydropteroate synthase